MKVISTYVEASRQEINLNKSEVFFSCNISNLAKEDLARIMGVRHVLGTRKYLGFPSMIGRSKKETFSFIKDRIWKKINSWRGRALSKAGKEVMIKLVLQAIPSYVMSLFILPDAVCNDIEKMLNSFWWGGGSNNKGIHWLACDKLAFSKKDGGLGFRDFKAFNMSMVAKQGWNLLSKPHALVSRIFKARYFLRTSYFESNRYNSIFMWRSIWKAKDVLSLGCRWSIGDGSQIKVMHEPWIKWKREGCLSGPQKQNVYDIIVKNLILPNEKQWNLRMIREMFNCAEAEEILWVPLLNEVKEDRMIWKEEQNGSYSMRFGYRLWRSLWRKNKDEGGTRIGIVSAILKPLLGLSIYCGESVKKCFTDSC
ncbi:unnamed protein product [Lathyrus sativus]|nr:unnamed protein product [Lathyrus sativus]